MIHRLSGWLADQCINHAASVRLRQRQRQREGIGLYSRFCTFMAYLCVTEIHYKEFHRKQVAQKRNTHHTQTHTDHRIAPAFILHTPFKAK